MISFYYIIYKNVGTIICGNIFVTDAYNKYILKYKIKKKSAKYVI